MPVTKKKKPTSLGKFGKEVKEMGKAVPDVKLPKAKSKKKKSDGDE